MAITSYTGLKTYVLQTEDSAWGTAGTPSGSDYLDKVTSASWSMENNMMRLQGIGEGRNATHATAMQLDCTGTIEWQVTDPDFMKYCVIGTSTGSGTQAAPYRIYEAERIGYDADEVKTLTLEMGSAESTADVMTFDGVCINSFTLNGEVGNPITATCEWVGRTGTSSTAAETYVGPVNRPFVYIDGQLQWGGEKIGLVQSFSITCANNLDVFGDFDTRLISQPEPGIRRYDISMTVRMHKDTAGSITDGIELRSVAFDGTKTSTTPVDSADFTASDFKIILEEGTAATDRNFTIQFENAYITTFNPTVETEGGVIQATITAYALAGKTDDLDSDYKAPFTWFTYA